MYMHIYTQIQRLTVRHESSERRWHPHWRKLTRSQEKMLPGRRELDEKEEIFSHRKRFILPE